MTKQTAKKTAKKTAPVKTEFVYKCTECGMTINRKTALDDETTCSGCYHPVGKDSLIE